MDWSFIEGSRVFEVTWGLVTGAICLALAVPILWWVLPGHRRSFFGRAIDPHGNLQVGYGVFAMAMACTNIGCRAIPHHDLPYVHPTFFLMTVALVIGLAPRLLVVARARA
jgi:hypothetical protein